MVLRNAKAFLDAIAGTGDAELVATKIADFYKCAIEDVRPDVHDLFQKLRVAGFLPRHVENPVQNEEPVVITSSAFDYTGEARSSSWTPLGEFYRRHNLPCELHVDLTDRCNERCVHCYIPKGVGKLIDDAVFYKAVKEFREAQGMTLYVSGGECMMHPKFFEYLRFAKDLDLNIVVMSNLTMCDDVTVARLREIDPQFVNVSLYSMDAQVHDSVTQVVGSWQKTMSAVLALERAGVPVRIATPVMRQNKDSIPALKQFTQEHRMHLIADCDIFGRIDHDCSNQNHALSPEEMERVISENRDVFYRLPAESDRCSCEAKVCDIGDGRLNLNAYGDYYPCDGFHGMVLGNAAKDALLDVWRGEKLNALRALKNKDFGACASCESRKWCKVCPMRNFNETGDMFKHAPERCVATAIRQKVFGGK